MRPTLPERKDIRASRTLSVDTSVVLDVDTQGQVAQQVVKKSVSFRMLQGIQASIR